MTLYQWFIFFLVLQVIHFLGTWKLYQKAGRKSWEAAIPVYNAIILMKIINRPAYWVILLFLPVINLIMFPVVWVETLRSFGKNSTLDTILGVATLGLYIYYINYTQDVTYIQNRSLVSTTKAGDTVSSILFAVVVATIVHTYFIQPFTIPTASLEKTLLVGDFLFVSKYNYGARVPMTPVALPMVHDTIPVAKTKSYLSAPQLPYLRFPGFEKVAKNDIVVFNWPVDTVHYFYEPKGRPGVIKPIDKKSNYVKRCVGTPGDVLSIKDGIVFINGKELQLSERAKPQYTHTVYAAKGVSNELLKATGSTEFTRAYIVKPESQEQINAIAPYATMGSSQNPDGSIKIFTGYRGIPQKVIQKSRIYAQEVYEASAQVNLTLKGAEELRKNPAIDSVVRYIAKIADKSPDDTSIFPHDGKWTIDNFGPVTIPQAGKSIALNKENLPLYQRIIQVYEKNDLKVNGDEIRINGQVVNSYTFKQDYFWMMGDNRHRSEDSRYWGFVPDDHIVGKPVFIWLSIDGINDGIKNWSIRWERLFTTVGGEGEPYSYFKFFLIAVAAYFGITFFLNKRKEKQTNNL